MVVQFFYASITISLQIPEYIVKTYGRNRLQRYEHFENYIANYSKLIAKSYKSLRSVACSEGLSVPIRYCLY